MTGAQIDGDRMDGYHKLGFVVGGAATLQISNRWSLRPEILFTQKGSRSTAADSLTYLRYRLNYVQIPVLLEYRVIPKLRLQAGISLDYLLGSGVDYGYGYQTPNPAFRKLGRDVHGWRGVRAWSALGSQPALRVLGPEQLVPSTAHRTTTCFLDV